MADALYDIAEPGASPTKEACQARAIGIDLGTTNSLVAIVDDGRPVCLPDENGAGAAAVGGALRARDGAIVVGARGAARRGARVSARHDRLGQALHGARAEDAETTRR